MEFEIAHVPYEDSAMGKIERTYKEQSSKQIMEIQRIANAAIKRADIAEQEAKSAKKDALFSKIVSVISILISLASLALSVYSAFFVAR